MMRRFAFSSLLAMLITFGLFWGMDYLISTGKNPTEGRIIGQRIEIGDVRPVIDNEIKIRKPDKPDIPSMPKENLDLDNLDLGITKKADSMRPRRGIDFGKLPMGIDVGLGAMGGFTAGDGDYLPIMKVAPLYPRRALDQGISGYVILEFTVTKLGTVSDIKVVKSTNSVFNSAAIKAALRFTYKPRMVDGEPIDVAGVLHKITFEFEQ